ncbi:hypothetical protein K1X12_06015 [Hyphomonas sp. WL0036]|uniref:hypothetical protein n=1 Tax=Hyphomonas sediminis TaxID=2866160 RepID=UPI001C817DB0|nr:hypothetical protein [Hyphomonas sediminis]MBY9066444.1 hypothetical protein [Hyphomonas sediminis]
MLKGAITVSSCSAAIVASLFFTHATFLAVVTGLVSGLMASVIFLLLLNDLQPKLRISHVIVRGKDRRGGNRIFVKVINQTRADILQPRATLHAITIAELGERYIAENIPLAAESPMIIERVNHKRPGENPNVYVFSAKIGKEEEEKISRNTSIRFRIISEHPVSGVKKIFERIYSLDAGCLLEGRFRSGAHFGVDLYSADSARNDASIEPDLQKA